MTAAREKASNSIPGENKPAKELKTEGPLSEKDEVKKAEQKTNKAIKKNS